MCPNSNEAAAFQLYARLIRRKMGWNVAYPSYLDVTLSVNKLEGSKINTYVWH